MRHLVLNVRSCEFVITELVDLKNLAKTKYASTDYSTLMNGEHYTEGLYIQSIRRIYLPLAPFTLCRIVIIGYDYMHESVDVDRAQL